MIDEFRAWRRVTYTDRQMHGASVSWYMKKPGRLCRGSGIIEQVYTHSHNQALVYDK